MATLLTLVTEFCERKGQPITTSVIGNTDTQVTQIKGLLQKEGDDLSARGRWQNLVLESTFTSVGTESQGSISAGLGSGPTLIPGYRYMVPNVLWDRTAKIPIVGALNSETWAYLKAMGIVGPYAQFRWRGNQLITIPALTAGHTIAFEYVSKNWIALQGGGTTANRFANDNDTVLLPDDIMQAGLEWRWLAAKGLAYAEDFNTYEDLVKDQLGREKPGRNLNLAGGESGLRPAITIPLMNTIPP